MCVEKLMQCTACFTIRQINAGKAGNVIPETGYMCGSIRAYEESVRELAKQRLAEISHRPCEMFGGRAEVIFTSELPATVNDDTVGEEMFGYVKELLGKEQTKILPPIMGSEDFGEVLKEVLEYFFDQSGRQAGEGYLYISHNAKVIFKWEDGMKMQRYFCVLCCEMAKRPSDNVTYIINIGTKIELSVFLRQIRSVFVKSLIQDSYVFSTLHGLEGGP